jgi:hypothetical protein
MAWHRVILSCPCPSTFGEELAKEIEAEFHQHYPHEHEVSCVFEDGKLYFASTNDYDPEGLNLMDEFSDVITAYEPEHFDGDIKFVSNASAPSPINDN